jgi:hypothetical protein
MAHTIDITGSTTSAMNTTVSHGGTGNSRPEWDDGTHYLQSVQDSFFGDNYWTYSDDASFSVMFGSPSGAGYLLKSDAVIPPKYGMGAHYDAMGSPDYTDVLVLAAMEEAVAITGAGSTAVNDRFVWASIYNSRFGAVNEADDHNLSYSGTDWEIRTGTTIGSGTVLYTNTDDGETVPTSGWTTDGGSAPAPSGFTLFALTAEDGIDGDQGLLIRELQGAKDISGDLGADLTGIEISPDGSTLYASKRVSNPSVFEFTMSTPWSITTLGSSNGSLNTSGEGSSNNYVTLNTAGTKLYSVGSVCHQYPMSSALDITTVGSSEASKDLGTLFGTGVGGVRLYTDTSLFAIGNNADYVFQATLSTAGDISTTGSADASLNVGSQDNTPRGLDVSSDGTLLAMVGEQTDDLHIYRMSTPGSLSTASLEVSIDISATVAEPNCVKFGDGDTKVYIAGETAGTIYQFRVQSLAWQEVSDGSTTITPDPVSVTITPVAPTINRTIVPDPVAIATTVASPTVEMTINPDPVAATLAPAAPTVEMTINPDPVAITLSLPEITILGIATLIDPDPVAVTIAPVAPTVEMTINPDPVAATLAPAAPSVEMTINPDPVAITLSVPEISLYPGVRWYTRPWKDGTDTFFAFTASGAEPVTLTGFAAGSEQWIHGRAVSKCGVEDIEPRRLKRVKFDGDGNFIAPAPNAPSNVKIAQNSDGQQIVTWNYTATGQEVSPANFNVYKAIDGAAFDYESPTDTVTFTSSRQFTVTLDAEVDGTTVRIVIRAATAAPGSVESDDSAEASIVIDLAAPAAPASIELEVTT